MRWFQKERKADVWETADVEPAGDIEAAQKIREICVAAETIAEHMVSRRGGKAERERASDAARYQAAIKCALEIARKISDDSMRDVSVSQIIGLCVKVDHLKTARVLLRAIQSEKTRAELIADSPALIDQEAAN
jgi:ubiquinone biosynthesis protein UbiJ